MIPSSACSYCLLIDSQILYLYILFLIFHVFRKKQLDSLKYSSLALKSKQVCQETWMPPVSQTRTCSLRQCWHKISNRMGPESLWPPCNNLYIKKLCFVSWETWRKWNLFLKQREILLLVIPAQQEKGSVQCCIMQSIGVGWVLISDPGDDGRRSEYGTRIWFSRWVTEDVAWTLYNTSEIISSSLFLIQFNFFTEVLFWEYKTRSLEAESPMPLHKTS